MSEPVPSWIDGENDDWRDQIDRREAVEAELVARMLNDHGEPVRTCQPDDFANPFFADHFRIINELRANRQVATPASILAKMPPAKRGEREHGVEVIRQIVRTFSASLAKPEDLAAVVSSNGAKARAYSALTKVSAMAMDGQQTAAAVAQRLEEIAEEVRSGAASLPLVTLNEIAMDIAEDLAGQVQPMSTGLQELDRVMAGGFWPGKLYGLQARPKVGKTVTAATMAWNVATAGVSTCYVALEMGAHQIAQRMIAGSMGFNSVRFLDRKDEAATGRLADIAANFADTSRAPLYFVDRPQMNFQALQSAMHDHARKAGCKFFVVDYWQLIRGKSNGQSQTEFLDIVAQWLADFAKSQDVAILCPAQENRDGECRFGDGLRMACSMYLRMARVETAQSVKRVFLEMLDSRYTLMLDVGDKDISPLWLDSHAGPMLREHGA